MKSIVLLRTPSPWHTTHQFDALPSASKADGSPVQFGAVKRAVFADRWSEMAYLNPPSRALVG